MQVGGRFFWVGKSINQLNKSPTLGACCAASEASK